MGRFVGLVASLLVLGAVWGTATASAKVLWLCKPGQTPNVCREPLTTTIQSPDGSRRVVRPALAARPKVDCFYVYPTVSGQEGTNADKRREDAVVAIARYQASRYASQCRVFAPIYRQLTLNAIFAGSSASARATGTKIAYADVREAFREYLKQDNKGRGFVLIGHSQGTGMLRRIVREEIDEKPLVRKRLVSALLLGLNVTVRKGRLDGGDFDNVPGCTRPTQLGCVIAFSLFNETPPSDTLFGRVPKTDTSGAGFPTGQRFEVLCTNPASLGRNLRRPLTALARTEPFPGTLGAGLQILYGGPPPTAATPWVQPPDRYTGRCERRNGANVLFVKGDARARVLKASPSPDWGLHLADANLALGELVDIVRRQAAVYAARAR